MVVLLIWSRIEVIWWAEMIGRLSYDKRSNNVGGLINVERGVLCLL